MEYITTERIKMQEPLIISAKSMADRVRLRRSELKMSQKELAALVGVGQADISKLEAGGVSRPHYVTSLAKALRVDPYWLESGKSSNIRGADLGKRVPVISNVRAGTWGEINDHEPDTDETIEARTITPSKTAFALKVQGDSMTRDEQPSFPDGTYIIVEPEIGAKPGDFVVAIDAATNVATFKRLGTDGSRWYLIALNKSYPPIEIGNEEKRIVGVVVEFWVGGKLR
jgi:SOS-response transcriptional repressor LexA